MLVTTSNLWLVEAERAEEALSAEPISESWPLSGIDKTCWGSAPSDVGVQALTQARSPHPAWYHVSGTLWSHLLGLGSQVKQPKRAP